MNVPRWEDSRPTTRVETLGLAMLGVALALGLPALAMSAARGLAGLLS